MTTARPGGRPCDARNVATSSATAWRISAAIGPPRGAAARRRCGTGQRRHAGAAGSRGSPLPDDLAGRRRQASRSSSSRSIDLRRRLACVDASSPTDGQVDEDVLRRAARGRLAEQRRDVQVARRVDVAPPGERLRAARRARGRPRRSRERHLGGVACRRLQRRRAGRLLVVRVAWAASSPRRSRRRPRRPRRPGRGSGPRRRWPPSIARSWSAACSAYFGRPCDSAATIATSAGAERRRDGRGAAAARHGLRRGEAVDERAERQVAEPDRRCRASARADCRVVRPAHRRVDAPRVTDAASVGNGAGAVPAHPPRVPTRSAGGGGSPAGTAVIRPRSGGGALLVEAVIVQRRDRCW